MAKNGDSIVNKAATNKIYCRMILLPSEPTLIIPDSSVQGLIGPMQFVCTKSAACVKGENWNIFYNTENNGILQLNTNSVNSGFDSTPLPVDYMLTPGNPLVSQSLTRIS